MSRETPPFAGFSDAARWKGPDGRKRCSLLALWVHGSWSGPTVAKDEFSKASRPIVVLWSRFNAGVDILREKHGR